MRRYWDLIRLLLLQFEGADVDLSPYNDLQIQYNRYLLAQSPLAQGATTAGMDAFLTDITERGHDFLSWARDDDEWDKVMTFIRERKLPESLDMIETVVNTFIDYPIAR